MCMHEHLTMMEIKTKFHGFLAMARGIIEEEQYQKYFATMSLVGVNNDCLVLRVPSLMVYERLEGTYYPILVECFQRFFKRLRGISYQITDSSKPIINRALSHKKMMEWIGAKGGDLISPGAARSAEELMGLMISNYNEKKNGASYKFTDLQGEKRLVFEFRTSYAGFAVARKPSIADKRTVKDHIKRLLDVGILIQSEDVGTYKRAKAVKLTFSPEIMVYSYAKK